MRRQKKNQAGITLIALVISIIVMLILAGVSLNATVGENGIVTRAQEAKEAMELAQTKEDLEYMFLDFNVDESETDIATWLEKKKQEGLIDDFKFWKNEGEDTFSYLLSKDGRQFYVSKQGDYYYATETQTSLDSIGAGIAIVTQDSFDASTGNMSFELNAGEKATMYFAEEVTGEFNFEIKGGTVDIYITQDMNLTNEGLKRSAIDIYPNATLNLHIAEGKTLNVNSGLGEDAAGTVPGKGGYAGIHVPEGAELNLYGSGTVTAIGGNAGNGFIGAGLQAGGGGAGAGIGGKGGDGGNPAVGVDTDGYRVAENGDNGENAGIINIYNDLTIYAYGGAGGSGGTSSTGDGGGAGGYPGAGIGGGGAGGAGATCCTGSGGFSAGSGGSSDLSLYSKNGLFGHICERCNSYWGGGGYYAGPENYSVSNEKISEMCFGGFGGTSYWRGHRGGDGGNGGSGGTVKVSEEATIYAFNGNLYTDGTEYGNGINQAPIYLQAGIKIAKYDIESWGNHTYDSSSDNPLYPHHTNLVTMSKLSDQENVDLSNNKYVNTIYTTNENFINKKHININTLLGVNNNPLTNVDMSKQGVGSGAGYVEVSNGTYTVDASLN